MIPLPHEAPQGAWVAALLVATFFNATPLTLAALGGLLSERSGVVNIALEGFILAGAFAGVWMGQGAALTGLAAALAVGALLGALHAFLTQKTAMNHVVSGLGINLLAAGATRYLGLRFFPSGVRIDGLPRELFLSLALLLPFVLYAVLGYTRFGLRLRSAGESPESARMAGILPVPIRFAAVVLSGILAALAGAYLSMADGHTFSSNMSAGKGYIALAAVIFGKWTPLGAAGGALFFGFFYALQTQFQLSQIHLQWLGIDWTSPAILDTLPYLMTLAALVSVVGRASPPAALGQEEV